MAMRAFTLVEILCAVVVISILLALAATGLSGARAAARRAVCGSNLRQIATVIADEARTRGDLPRSTPTALMLDYGAAVREAVPGVPDGAWRCGMDRDVYAEIGSSYTLPFLFDPSPRLILAYDSAPSWYVAADASYEWHGGKRNQAYLDGHVEFTAELAAIGAAGGIVLGP